MRVPADGLTPSKRAREPRHVRPPPLAVHRPRGQPVLGRGRRAGGPARLLRRCGIGGIYKTLDAGVTWQPIFDGQPVQSIGSLAVAASDPNTVWAGTGEGKIRSHISVGQGIYKSLDAGKTWTLMGLEQTGRIPRLVIDPKDSKVVLACALGHAYGPQPERGVFRTTDGGQTWTKVLFVDDNTGCSDIAMDPKNPRVLFAGMWQLEIHTWGRVSGGPGSGLYRSQDGGATWKKLAGSALPTRPVGKVAVAIAQSNPNRVYAMIETGDGVPWEGQPTDTGQVWRSDDGGDTWQLVSHDHLAMGRAHYYSRMAVAPDDEDEAYFLTASFAKSIDGARGVAVVGRGPRGHLPTVWRDTRIESRWIMIKACGLSLSVDGPGSGFGWRLRRAKMSPLTMKSAIPSSVPGKKRVITGDRGPGGGRAAGGVGRERCPDSRRGWVAVGERGGGRRDRMDSIPVWSAGSGFAAAGWAAVWFD